MDKKTSSRVTSVETVVQHFECLEQYMITWRLRRSVSVYGKSGVKRSLLSSHSKTIIYGIQHHAFYLED